MNADELQDLYHNLRGSRAAQSVLDARELYLEKRMSKAFDKLSHSRDTYQQSRSRLLRQPPERQVDAKARNADQQIKRIARKQKQALEILETFEKLLSQLERLAQREERRKLEETSLGEAPDWDNVDSDEPSSDADPDPKPDFATSSDVTPELAEAFQQADGEDQLNVINEAFGFREVTSKEDIHPSALYLIRTDEESYSLAYTRPADEIAHTIYLENAAGNKPIPEYSQADFVSLGTEHQMVLLTPKPVASEGDKNDPLADKPNQTTDDSPGTKSGDDQAQDSKAEDAGTQNVLDMGAFSQLMDSAQRSGIVPGADKIAHVRDREFRMGNYDLALQLIEGMFAAFTASANQRNQRLTREEADIASGRVKMSPKKLHAKRARDRMQTQAVERARNRFQRVLDGLRIMIRSV